jgi:hypothetical protein
VRFTTEDGRFGFLIEPTSYSGMFRFQLVLAGQLVGDEEPCFLESAMGTLRSLPVLTDARLDAVRSDPASVLAALRTDEALHDATTLSIAESLDRWLVCAYVNGEQAIFLTRAYSADGNELVGPLLTAIVPLRDYAALLDDAAAATRP